MATTRFDTLSSDRLVAGGATPSSDPGNTTIPVFIVGSGAPTVIAPKGSLYLRSDGVPYVATDAVGTWATIGATSPQALAATDSPTFVGLTLSGVLTGLTNLIMTGALSGATNITQTGFHDMTEIADPAAPAALHGRIYMKDVGGKVAFVARFPTGAVQQIAVEP